MSYDSPLRVTYQFSGVATAALTRQIPVPDGADRFRVVHVSMALQAGSADSTNTHEIGIVGDTDAFHSLSLAVTAAAPAAAHGAVLDSNAVDTNAAILLTRSADAVATGDTVETFLVIDWY